MARESNIVRSSLVKYLKSRPRCYFRKLHGSPFAKRGTPDFVVLDEGRTFWFEVKNERGRQSPLQKENARQITKAGGTFAQVRSVEEVRACLEGNPCADW